MIVEKVIIKYYKIRFKIVTLQKLKLPYFVYVNNMHLGISLVYSAIINNFNI